LLLQSRGYGTTLLRDRLAHRLDVNPFGYAGRSTSWSSSVGRCRACASVPSRSHCKSRGCRFLWRSLRDGAEAYRNRDKMGISSQPCVICCEDWLPRQLSEDRKVPAIRIYRGAAVGPSQPASRRGDPCHRSLTHLQEMFERVAGVICPGVAWQAPRQRLRRETLLDASREGGEGASAALQQPLASPSTVTRRCSLLSRPAVISSIAGASTSPAQGPQGAP